MARQVSERYLPARNCCRSAARHPLYRGKFRAARGYTQRGCPACMRTCLFVCNPTQPEEMLFVGAVLYPTLQEVRTLIALVQEIVVQISWAEAVDWAKSHARPEKPSVLAESLREHAFMRR